MAQPPDDGVAVEKDGVQGFLLAPAKGAAEHGLVLTHGAGGNCSSPLLLAVARAFQAAGVAILRCDLPFRQQRRSGPPIPGKSAVDRAGLKRAVEYLRSAGENLSRRSFLRRATSQHACSGGAGTCARSLAAFLSAPSPDQARGIADPAFSEATDADRVCSRRRRPFWLDRGNGAGDRLDFGAAADRDNPRRRP